MSLPRGKHFALITAAIVGAVFYLTPWAKPLEFAAYDSYYWLRGSKPIQNEIIFVAIDENSFLELGLQWPWPRSVHAELLRNIYTAGAKVVAVDILFSEESEPAEDTALTEVLEEYGPTVLAADIGRSEDNRFIVENNIRPLDIFITPTTRLGHVRNVTDRDGFVRRADRELRDLKSLAYAAAYEYLNEDCCKYLPDEKFPLINFFGGPGVIQTVSYYQALDPQRYLPPDVFKDKLVIVGVNTTTSAMPNERRPDHYPTPYTRWGIGYAPGALIHATVIANLLYEGFIAEVPALLAVLAGLTIALSFGLFTFELSFLNSSLIAAVTAILASGFSFWLFLQHRVYLSPIGLLLPLLTAYLFSPYYRYLVESRRRAFIRKTFSTYVNPTIVDQLEKNPDSLRLGGKQVAGTALFLDIAGFTSLSEKHDPETMVSFINEFLSRLITIAMDTDGTVERFLGDAIMVIWGAPIEQPDHAQRAAAAALAMALEVAAISEQEMEHLGAPVTARIGINSGTMTAGNIGANRRFNYTVLGDSVNLAARLEELNKMYGTTILVGSATRALLGDGIVVRYLDKVRVRGRQQTEDIYELVGTRQDIGEAKLGALAAYAEGLDLYQQGNWAEAQARFRVGLAVDPDDGPCATMQARCRQYEQVNPLASWDGVFDT
jgi:adenylate cyclase